MTPLLEAIGAHARPGDHVVDAFSGSLSVAMGLKSSGYRVTANDINLFSSVLAEAYLVPTALPDFDASRGIVENRVESLSRVRQSAIESLHRPDYEMILNAIDERQVAALASFIEFLNSCDDLDLPDSYRRTDFYDAYCEAGTNSRFVSSRGRSGNRRFFKPQNARRIDRILNHLRFWNREGLIRDATLAILLASTLRAVEKVANTQGTYHDFPRSNWDSRALNPLVLEMPDLRYIYAGGPLDHYAGREQDTLEFISSVDHHSVLYLDPPYNFRQYSAYYFLLNVICRYVEMEDPSAYFGNLMFVRGQNPDDDFASSFCKASRFIEDMRTLIRRADCDTVVISYFNGKNHWSKFDSGPDSTGQLLLEQLLAEPMFEQGSQRTVLVPRRNYASYVGYTARDVSELILSARVVQDREGDPTGAVRQPVPQMV
ncbi:Adenine-specific DNA methylase [Paramicrobacterium humi]|uniref:Adenine-specific DNA methylase n=2 Tax=Paramicrobacterium humi TaxID=640635 RepID=A0A1H4KE29_9MICO|nr:Adenine-specific DNA methylase [Microbacterium humi]